VFANFLIGLREGLEASLVVSILVAYLVKVDRRDRLVPVAGGVGAAIALSVAFGALLTYTSADVLQTGQQRETFGGTLSIISVGFVTWMIFWMRRTARNMRSELSGSMGAALELGVIAVAATAFIAVAREGLETALFFWSAVQAAGSTLSPVLGFSLGVATSVVIAWLLYRRSVSLNLARFFTWTGVGLVIVAAGVLAYGVHDLQEGGVLGGLSNLAFDISAQVPPSSWYGTVLKGTINLSPQTTVLQAIVWTAYIVPVMYLFLRGSGASRLPARGATAAAATLLLLVVAGCGGAGDKVGVGDVGVTAGDSSCATTHTKVGAGTRTFKVKNTGSQVTEVYVYGGGDRIMGEVENIGPALSRDLIVQLPPGKYEVACKPGMVGDGIRQPLSVSGKSAAQPVSAQLRDAVAGYRRYVRNETRTLLQLTIPFAQAVRDGDIPLAKRRYAVARVHYERIEPIAESFAALDTAIDIRADGVDPGAPWTGFHRLERDLWQRGDISKDGPLADLLVRDVRRLGATVAKVKITPDQLGNGARSLMDEVAKGKVTGEEERYSHTDLVDFQGNLDGAKTAYAELRPIVVARDAALARTLDARFDTLQTLLSTHARGSGFKPYTSLTKAEVRALADRVDAVAEPLSRVTAVVLR
jgi:high-affinity iron transporter